MARGAQVQAKGKGADAKGATPPPQTDPSPGAPSATTPALTSFDIFELCVARARNLIKLHQAAHGKAGKPEPYASDAHRGAIVLAIAALEAFVRDFVIHHARQRLSNKAQTLPDALKDRIKKFLNDDALLDAARKDDLLERVEAAFRSDFEKRSFQGTRNIEDLFRVVGFDSIFHEVAVSAGINEDTLRAQIEGFTKRRHAIAHRGDYDLNQRPPRENGITKRDAEDCVRLVCLIAKHMHEVGSKP